MASIVCWAGGMVVFLTGLLFGLFVAALLLAAVDDDGKQEEETGEEPEQ